MKRIFQILILALAVLVSAPGADIAAQQRKERTTTQTTKKRTQQSGAKKKSSGAKKSSGTKKSNSGAGASKKGTGSKNAGAKGKKNRTASEVKQEKQRNARELKETNRKIQLNTKETEQRLNQLTLLEGEIADCNVEIGRLSHRLDSVNGKIKVATDSIEALDGRLEAITGKYVAAIRKTQAHRQNMSELAFIFSSESFAQAYRRARSLRQFDKWRKRRSAEIADMRADLEARRKALTSLKTDASQSLASLNRERATLVKKQGETNTLVGRLKKEGGELREIMARRQREASALDDELDRIIAEEARRQEELRRKEEAERKARLEAERKAREEQLAREAEAARQEQERLEAKRREELAAMDEAERKAAEKADRELKKKQEAEAKKAARERQKAEREAEKKAKEAEKAAAREQTKKGKPVKHKGKNNGRGDVASEMPLTGVAPTLKAPAATGVSGIAAEPEAMSGGDFGSYKGRLPFPITGKYTIVKRFGRQKHPTLPHVEITNSGIDMATAAGASVRSVFDGEVSAVFRPDGYNNVVVIRHGRYMTVYANLGTLSVSTGQKVKAGQQIGTVYADPNDDHRSVLHFEIRNQKQKENPELWLKK